jgi:hypothetical protein
VPVGQGPNGENVNPVSTDHSHIGQDGAIVYASKRAWPQQRCSFSIVVQVVGWQPAWRRVCSKPNCYVIAVRNVVRYLHSM